VFVLTPSGETRLRELLSEPIQPVQPRNGLMLRLFFGRQLGPEACRALLIEAKSDAQRLLAGYAGIREEILGEAGEDAPYWLLTVSAGEHTTRAVIAWVDESLEALDEIDGSTKRRN
jgi:hypothetical protein